MHEVFVGKSKIADSKVITASSFDNTYLPDGYIETMQSSFSSQFARQEIYGEFVNIAAGRIFYAFERESHTTDISFNHDRICHTGMDFNRSPMSAVTSFIERNILYVFKEHYIKDSNTDQMARKLLDEFGPHTIYPDATGRAIKTSAAGRSDHSILKEYGFKIMHNNNPFRMDRYNVVNKLFEDCKLMIDKSCVNLIRDLEQLSFKEGTNLPDTSNPDLGHLTDALGYLCYRTLNPFMQAKSSKTITF